MCKQEKERNIRETAERLYDLRYLGKVEKDEYLYSRFLKEYDNDFNKFSKTFLSAGVPRTKEILFTEKLFDELEKIADESNVEVSTLINCYLLQMLERNKRTTEYTKARKAYIKNSLYETSQYIQRCEDYDKFYENISDKDFMKYKQISFNNTVIDEETYIINFLINKGYSLKQIQELEKEEKEKFGVYKTQEGEAMRPTILKIKIVFVDNKTKKPVIPFDYDYYILIPTRLGFHYMILNDEKIIKELNLNGYKEIENHLNTMLKGGKKIWDLYKEYLEENPY